MDNYFLTNINRTIGENMRFARSFQSNQQAQAQNQAVPPPGAFALAEMLHPLLFMMLFQFMQQVAPNPSGTPDGNAYPWFPVQTPQPPQNPALSQLLGVFQQKLEAAQPAAEELILDDDEVAAIRSDLSSGKLSEAQLGHALKYLLVHAEDRFLPAISGLLSDLVHGGELNITPFLQEGYLDKLSETQRNTLLQTVEQAGLHLDDGRTNARLSAFLMDALNRSGDSAGKSFSRTLLQSLHTKQAGDFNNPTGKTLTQLMDLANVTVGDDGTLVFP